ncbi:MAG: SDR family NAD(P)-dependent oxidoreductase [Gammaproteobacteria bacterium]|nr:SDR family NAD(P)-dependent oxidoreductase [Gammaproteobacteria bacterium]
MTGASRGLGRVMALNLARQGAVVAAVARAVSVEADENDLAATVRQIQAAGGRALAIAADVRDEAQVQAMAEQVVKQYGCVDVLVNNAGLMIGDKAFADISPALWSRVLDTNLRGAYLCCRAVLPAMRQQGHGVIVNITSGAAVRTGFLNIAYGVSKAGLDRLTFGLADELRDAGIACISLSPPVSATDSVRRMYAGRDVDAWAQPPELTAQALSALLDDDPWQYTGQVLSVREYLRSKGLMPPVG